MKSKKGFKYYIIVFFFSVIALGIYVAYLSIKAGEVDYALIYSLLLVPFMFTIFLFAFDKVFDLIFPSKEKKIDSEYKAYIERVGRAIEDNCEFSIEDYRRLRGNASFQKSIEQGYRILNEGESEEISFQYLEKKFKKNTNEFTALSVVIEEVRKMMENS